MFTTTFTLDRQIEELRAEFRANVDSDERAEIWVELHQLLAKRAVGTGSSDDAG